MPVSPSLRDLRGRFDPEARNQKLTALAAVLVEGPQDAERCARVNDDLLFVRAFPDDPEVWEAARAGLAAIDEQVGSLSRKQRKLLDDSGIAGTTSRHTYSYGAARWMVSRGEKVSIDWSAYRKSEQLDPLIRQVLHPLEVDAFESGDYSTREWVELAAAHHAAIDWLLRDAPGPDDDRYGVWSTLYDAAQVPLAWDLTASRRSTTLASIDVERPVARAGFRRLPSDPPALIAQPLEGIRRLEGTEAEAWHDVCAASLAARCREVLATFDANRDEIYLADLGEGVKLCILGLARALRLPIEANYGYVMVSNGVPIGYGGATPLGPQANTGINIFEPFRKSEAGMLFAQALRAFATLFGVRRFLVNPYQFGKENDEGIASGAYWFYDRLGFRPRTVEGNLVRERERSRHEADPTYRSDAAALEQLATEDLVLTLAGGEQAPLIDERILTTVGVSVSRLLAASSAPTRLREANALMRMVGDAFAPKPINELDERERFGLGLLSPMLASLMGIANQWSPGDRAGVWELVRLKGETQERDYARHSATAWALWSALLQRTAGSSPG
jgi:hypothetical protein